MKLKSLLSTPGMEDRLAAKRQARFSDAWHSFDTQPWNHPWLTRENLIAMKEYSKAFRENLRAHRAGRPADEYSYGFVCNIANSMYSTAQALHPRGVFPEVLMHPFDNYLLSQPEWEEFDGELPAKIPFSEAVQAGVSFPEVERVNRTSILAQVDSWFYEKMPGWVSASKFFKWRNYYCFLPMMEASRKHDALFAIQSPYFAYLSQTPYAAVHMGGDIWYEASRDDQLGQLQRTAFGSAKLLVASNPWSYAFARRYGMRNLVYIPTLLDPAAYAPGEPSEREAWRQQTGGDFFVLTTARADSHIKGSEIALHGFATFAKTNPGARLIALGWGNDIEKQQALADELGIGDKVFVLPTVGKKRLIKYLRSADCMLDQFVVGYFGMTALEALACGLPVIMKLDAEQFDAFSETGSPPVCNASDVEQVAQALVRLADDQNFRSQMASESRAWFMRYSGNAEWADALLDVLYAVASGFEFDYSASPLNADLTPVELEYHAQQLRIAPAYPNYI